MGSIPIVNSIRTLNYMEPEQLGQTYDWKTKFITTIYCFYFKAFIKAGPNVYINYTRWATLKPVYCVWQVFQGSDEELQDIYQNHQGTVREKERRLTECQKELERAGRECQRLNRIKAELLGEQGTHSCTPGATRVAKHLYLNVKAHARLNIFQHSGRISHSMLNKWLSWKYSYY